MTTARINFILAALLAISLPSMAADEADRSAAPSRRAEAADTASAASGQGQLLAPVIPPLIIIAPTEVRTDPTLARGCWVRMFPQTDFKGNDDLTVAGPLELPALHTPLGVDWKHKTQSMLVGPKATVTVYEGPRFSAKEATFKPGTQVNDLRKEMKYAMGINSMKIACSK